ncbi:MAG TPA: hypothetical protein VKC60_14825 [Opitutaceae bacterium]|nr:hypothetical protein [Opitutaceae bacterium]
MQTTFEEFLKSVAAANTPPAGVSLALQALWYDAKGDWERAHTLAQEEPGKPGAWVHAYLHRKEGDDGNAGYWYARASRKACTTSLQDEWNEIVKALLG